MNRRRDLVKGKEVEFNFATSSAFFAVFAVKKVSLNRKGRKVVAKGAKGLTVAVRRAAVSLVDEAQAVERQRLVNFVYELGGGRDERGESARRDDAGPSS